MSSWPLPAAGDAPPLVISTSSLDAIGLELANLTTNAWGSTGFPAGNHAQFIPFRVGTPFLVRRLQMWNSSTGGSFDMGIYDLNGVRLASSGNTATANTIQSHDLSTPLYLAPGGYYLAGVMNSNLQTCISLGVDAKYLTAIGVRQVNLGSTVLPATVTLASFTDTGRVVLLSAVGNTAFPG